MSQPSHLSLVRDGYLTDDYLAALERETLEAERTSAPEAATSERRSKFHLLTIEEVEALPPVTWLVQGILPDGAAAEIHGPPGAGKTFVTLDLAMCVATGRPFFGAPVRRGWVVYVIGEGQRGVGQRTRAWKEARGVTQGIQMRIADEPVQLLEPRDLVHFIQTLTDELPEPPVLIVLDTLARCFLGGEENSAKDMGIAVAAVDHLRKKTGATVLLVHHTRKAGDEERGSIALRGGMDTMMSLKEEDDGVVLACEKQKDGPPFRPIPVQLRAMGDSMVVDEPRPQLGPSRSALRVLERLVRDFPGSSATSTEWREAAGMPASSFYRARGELLRKGLVAESKHGNSTRYTPTPDGKFALAYEARDAQDSQRSHSIPNGFPTAESGAEAGGLGGYGPPTEGLAPHPAGPRGGSANGNGSGFSRNSQFPPDSHSHDGNGNLDQADLLAELDERLGMREEPPLEDDIS